jgi:hypothetical protein
VAAGVRAGRLRAYHDAVQGIVREVRENTTLPDCCASIVADYVGVVCSSNEMTITVDDLVSPAREFLVYETDRLRGIFNYMCREMEEDRHLVRFYRRSDTDPGGDIEIRNSELCLWYKGATIVCRRRLHLYSCRSRPLQLYRCRQHVYLRRLQ